MPNLWIIFTTGLVTGGISCLAVQGGLLGSLIVGIKKNNPQISQLDVLITVGKFLTAKLFAYVVLGFLLGLLGQVLVPSVRFFGLLQIVVSLYMFGVVGALLDLHPFFRRFLIQTPRFLNRIVRDQSKKSDTFAAVLLGLLTVVIPCGTTQAMMAQAIGTGNPVYGASVMGVFVLGTIPLFILLGIGAMSIGEVVKSGFTRVAAAVLAIVAFTTLNGGLILSGSNVYPSAIARTVYCGISFCGVDLSNPADVVQVKIGKLGYELSNNVIKAGSRIKLMVNNIDGGGCQQAFTIPSLGISKIVGLGQSDVIEFDAPKKSGSLAFSCSMGMYEGHFNVVN